MKKSTIRAIAVVASLAAGATQAQTLVLSDSFDTGGVAVNDLNYNQGARQTGTAAPVGFSRTTPESVGFDAVYDLTADGKLRIMGGGDPAWHPHDYVVTDDLDPQIGTNSFSIKWTAQQMESDGTNDATLINIECAAITTEPYMYDLSPISVILWDEDNSIGLQYGSITNNRYNSNNIGVVLGAATISYAIGVAYDANDEHEFEIRAYAESATNGLWSFYVDGARVAYGLPYVFPDTVKKVNWQAQPSMECHFDNLEVSTIPFLTLTKVIDNVDAGYSETGSGWATWQDEGEYGVNFRFKGGSTTNDTAAWAFTGLSNGNYKVYASWPANPNASPAAPYSGTDSFNQSTVNQTNAPAADLVMDSVNFQELGIVAVADGDFTCTLTGGAGQLRADAVALHPTEEPAPPFAIVVGLLDGGFSQTGFSFSGGIYFANDGGASASASWEFTGVPDGTYEVMVSWEELGNRSTEAPYSFSQGLASVEVNQRIAAADYEIDGTNYGWLGTVSITNGVFSVTLTDDASTAAETFVIAQSVALVSSAESVVVDNVDAGYAETGTGWATWQGEGEYGVDFRYKTGSTTNDTASWEFSGLSVGIYDVYACWPANPNASTSAPYSGTDGFITVSINQTNTPTGTLIHGTRFQRLGMVAISDRTFTGTVTGGAGQVRADAMALVLKKQFPHPPIAVQVASDGSTLYFEWNSETGSFYDLESTDSLTFPSWSGYNSHTNIAASGTFTNTLIGVVTDGAVRFFRVIGN